MSRDINSLTITGRLTADPELKNTQSGIAVARLRVAVNGRRKEGENWVDKPGFFDVDVWAGQGENCGRYLTKGSFVVIEGELDWQEWVDRESGQKRSTVRIKAHNVHFGPRVTPAPGQPAEAVAQPVPQPVAQPQAAPAAQPQAAAQPVPAPVAQAQPAAAPTADDLPF